MGTAHLHPSSPMDPKCPKCAVLQNGGDLSLGNRHPLAPLGPLNEEAICRGKPVRSKDMLNSKQFEPI